MSGKKMNGNKTVNDYISAVAQGVAAGKGQLIETAELRRAEETVQDLTSRLRNGSSTPIVGEFDYEGTRAHVIGYLEQGSLSVDETGCIGVQLKPGHVVKVGENKPEYRKDAMFIPLGEGKLSLSGDKSTHVHVRHRGRPTTSFYVGGKALEAAMETEFGYSGDMPRKMSRTFAKRLKNNA